MQQKKIYFETELKNNQSDLKKTWQLLKSEINKKSNKSTHILKLVNGKYIENPKEIASVFNEFFTSMPGKIVEDLHTVDVGTRPDLAKKFLPLLTRMMILFHVLN